MKDVIQVSIIVPLQYNLGIGETPAELADRVVTTVRDTFRDVAWAVFDGEGNHILKPVIISVSN